MFTHMSPYSVIRPQRFNNRIYVAMDNMYGKSLYDEQIRCRRIRNMITYLFTDTIYL